ncbi:TetR/AcrR family transcriptional regulator [Streptomyces sp. JH14]|uniref:TetR/AcrR family transcriptional regulator n=1 Tax=Streptomyces sp. JH14 TaxID=2793630 RepID=UPI0023F948D8|nr:TetR/AcrR family transcriptional regulator [Streptomyces sp. JH14]MDF6042264.1 TetR/AcrR family transcriptional regulator [Streptomyces sp. JH14]
MPRPPDPAKRRALLDRVRQYLIRNGLADLSLRPLARSLGTSDRMLLYYFGSKERMVAEALALDERRPLLRARTLLDTTGPPKDPAWLRRFMEEIWQRLSDSDLRAALPLYLEIVTASLLHPERYGPLMHDIVSEWTGLLGSVFRDMGMPEARARTEAALLVNASFGLVIASLADGDWHRADAAFRTLLDRLEPGWHTT